MKSIQLFHAHQICGITAHVKDRGVASVAIRSLAIAAECLSERREQEEVLKIFDKIRHETGWKVGFLHDELKTKWNWDRDERAVQPPISSLSNFFQQSSQPPIMPPTTTPGRPKLPSGIVNPMYKEADFGAAKHPYMGHYQPPSIHGQSSLNQGQSSLSGGPGTMGWNLSVPPPTHLNAPVWYGQQ